MTMLLARYELLNHKVDELIEKQERYEKVWDNFLRDGGF